NPTYLRKKLGVVGRQFDVPLASRALGVGGAADEVLTLADGTMAPFDYKFAGYGGRVYRNQKVTAALYRPLVREAVGVGARRRERPPGRRAESGGGGDGGAGDVSRGGGGGRREGGTGPWGRGRLAGGGGGGGGGGGKGGGRGGKSPNENCPDVPSG